MGAIAKKIAAITGSSATSRRWRIINSIATAEHQPTHALRTKLSARLTASAGMTTAGHTRDFVMNSTRATARFSTSIMRPEKVREIPSVLRGR